MKRTLRGNFVDLGNALGVDLVSTWKPTEGVRERLTDYGRELLDASQGNDHELALRATARPAVARVSAATAERLGLGEVATVEAGGVAVILPVEVTPGMVDDVVWVPLNPNSVDRLPATPGAPAAVAAVSVDEGA